MQVECLETQVGRESLAALQGDDDDTETILLHW